MANPVHIPRPTEADELRFWNKVNKTDDPNECWEWNAATFVQGYGQFWFRGKFRRAHRVIYVWTYGELSIEHAVNARKTHCVNGHEFTAANTFYDAGGWRQCKECRNARARSRYQQNIEQMRVYARSRIVHVSHEPRACAECGTMFTPRRSDSTYCSVNCGQRFRHRRRQQA